MSRPTIRDVADAAGVSTATVSYVLNGTGSVSRETAARVRACVAELGYRANSLAVAQRTGRSQAIGLAVPDLTNPFFPEFAQGVHRAASAEGLSVLLLDAHNSSEDEVAGIERFSDRVPDGLIWVPVRHDIISGRNFTFPTVVFGQQLDGFDSVSADVRRGGELQAEAVLAHGHRRVGLLSGPPWAETAQLRRDGFLDRIGSEAEVVWDCTVDYKSADLSDHEQTILGSDVSCAVTANDIQAISLMKMFRSAGKSVPEDVSVIGFDDVDLSALVSPPLTTVHLGARELGYAAFGLLNERMGDPDRPARHRVIDVSMTVRESLRSL